MQIVTTLECVSAETKTLREGGAIDVSEATLTSHFVQVTWNCKFQKQ